MKLTTSKLKWIPISLITAFIFYTPKITAQENLNIVDLGKTYKLPLDKLEKGLYFPIPSEDVNHGNTSIRNTDEAHLRWKDSPNSNGYGYFQRNRDMGQVFNVPKGKNITIDALVLRTSKGRNAFMKGASGAQLYVLFYEVKTSKNQPLKINENGTYKGDLATHGFDHQFNRCDDFIEGDKYIVLHKMVAGICPNIPATTQTAYPRDNKPFGEQEGHLRYLKFDFFNDAEITLEGGKRYAFIVGFTTPGKDRGIAWSISTTVHTKEPAEFVKDENGLIRWGIRREGNGTLPPTMIENATPPKNPKDYNKLVTESLFPKNHYETLAPTTNGYPDVDTYRTMEFYLELK
ncbi:hypothetical protein [Tamlana sp. I1]|uniref:hypothetical protein n=1 Tax=Tamlana sp. I1 TaxID=2762061 RepID=UPI001890B1A5|nr:hypothetical protein [Tamlana sp. I1]